MLESKATTIFIAAFSAVILVIAGIMTIEFIRTYDEYVESAYQLESSELEYVSAVSDSRGVDRSRIELRDKSTGEHVKVEVNVDVASGNLGYIPHPGDLIKLKVDDGLLEFYDSSNELKFKVPVKIDAISWTSVYSYNDLDDGE